MRTKYFLSIVFGILACMLVMDGLVLQPLINHGSNLAYARGGPPDRSIQPFPYQGPGGSTQCPKPDEKPVPVSEPSILLLLGMGVTGMGVYLYSKHRKDKK